MEEIGCWLENGGKMKEDKDGGMGVEEEKW